MAKTIVSSAGLLVFMALSLPALAAGGYDGLIAPTKDNDTPATGATKSPPKGYYGLTLGATAPDEEEAKPKPAPSPQYTPSPVKPEIIHDLGMASALYAPKPPLKSPVADFSTTQHPRTNGELAMPHMVRQQISQAMDSINDKKLSGKERDKNAQNAYKRFSDLANGLRNQNIPDSVYKSMGLTDTYIREERQGNADALKQLDSALDVLKPLQ
jgi:hypothetical protein